MNPLLLKWGGLLTLLIASAFYVDHRARGQVHEEYRVAQLEATALALEKVEKDFKERARIDNENFQLIVALQTDKRRALDSQHRMRQSLDAFGLSCDSSASPGCKAARDIGELLNSCTERYRQLGDEASENYLRAKKVEALTEVE